MRLGLLAAHLIAAPALAQGPVSLGGYVENTTNTDYRLAREQMPVFANIRARVNLNATIGDSVDAGITAIGALNTGATTLDLAEFLPRSVARELPPGVLLYELESEAWLQEAFGSAYLGDLKLRAGRQKIYSGTGHAFNPIDLLNYKNPLDPTYELEGIDALLASVAIGDTELEAAYSFGSGFARERPYDDIGDGDWLARLKLHLGLFDLTLQVTSAMRHRTDVESVLAGRIPIESATTLARWHLASIDFAGELAGVGLHGEGGWAWVASLPPRFALDRDGKDHARFLIGADYTFEWQLEVMAEYLFDGQGRTDRRDYTLNERFGLLMGERLSLGRDTLFVGLRYPVTDLISGELYGIVTINDPSALINPWVVWEAVEGLTVSASAQVPAGYRNSVNGRAGPGGFVRLRYSF